MLVTLNVGSKTGGPANSLTLPVSDAELEVIRSVARFLLPHMLGFDKVV